MAFTQADVELLEAAIRTSITDGTWRARSIAFSDQVVNLVSLDEAMKFLAWMRAQVTSLTTRTRFAATSKGI